VVFEPTTAVHSMLNEGPFVFSDTESTDPGSVTIHVLKCIYMTKGDLLILNFTTTGDKETDK
jgi:hypothetical protein